MDQQRFGLKFDGGNTSSFTGSLAVLPADRVAFERQFEISVLNFDENSGHEEWLLFFIWRVACRKAEGIPDTFEGFIEQLLEYDIEQLTPERERLDPIGPPAAPTGSSPKPS